MDIFQEYFIIEVRSLEWHVVLQSMIKRYHPEAMMPGDFQIMLPGEFPVYYLRRSVFPIEEVARVTNRHPEELREARVVRLFPLDPREYPDPTVNYIGYNV